MLAGVSVFDGLFERRSSHDRKILPAPTDHLEGFAVEPMELVAAVPSAMMCPAASSAEHFSHEPSRLLRHDRRDPEYPCDDPRVSHRGRRRRSGIPHDRAAGEGRHRQPPGMDAVASQRVRRNVAVDARRPERAGGGGRRRDGAVRVWHHARTRPRCLCDEARAAGPVQRTERATAAVIAEKHSDYFPRPSPEKYRAYSPTIGHIAITLLVAHPPHHLGQLKQWRRAAGIVTRVIEEKN